MPQRRIRQRRHFEAFPVTVDYPSSKLPRAIRFMSSLTTQQHFRSRILSMDKEKSSFAPIIGVDKAPDVSIYDSLMHAWRSCPTLQSSLTENDMEVIATAARLHFMSLSGPDPHGLNEHQAASIHVYTQESAFYHILNELLRGTDRSKLEPFKPYLKLLLMGLNKIPPAVKTLYRGVQKSLGQLSQQFEKGKPVVWWSVTSTASHVSVLEQFLGKSGDRCMFTINAISARDIQRYSAMGSTEREFVLSPGSCLMVEDILDAGHGLTIVQMAEDASMTLLKLPGTISATTPATSPGLGRYAAPGKHVVNTTEI